jgi:hypothetical protein
MTKSEQHSRPSLAILIPIYKNEFDLEEQRLVDRMFNVFIEREITFVGPVGLNFNYYERRFPSAKLKLFESSYFESIQGYSRLLLSKGFYDAFDDKEFILISQPDVYVFRDDLDIWLQRPYHFLAPPWPRGFSIQVNIGRFATEYGGSLLTSFVGNGGFSLRRIEHCSRLLDSDKELASWFSASGSSEDLFFSFIGAMTPGFVLPNVVEASLFGMEMDPNYLYSLNGGRLPMGVHAYKKHSPEFWKPYIDS